MKTSIQARWLLGILAFLLYVTPTLARFDTWQPQDGVALRQGRHVFFIQEGSAVDANGNILATWSESPSGTMNVHAQLFSPEGSPLWTGGDLILADNPYPDQEPRVVRSSDDAWIISWLSWPSDFFGGGDIYLQKVSDDGQLLWPEPVGPLGQAGTSLYEKDYGSMIDLMAGPNGSVTLAWAIERQRITMQRVSADGDPMFHTLPEFPRYAWPLPICSDGEGGIYVTGWQYSDREIYIQHLTSEGGYGWGTDPLGLLVGTGSWSYVTPACLENGDVTVLWTTMEGNVHAQKYSPDGETLYAPEGTSVFPTLSNSTSRFVSPSTGNSRYLGYRSTDTDGNLLQRVDFSGEAPNLEWEGDGLPLTTSQGPLLLDPEGGALLSDWDWSDEMGSHFTFTRIASDGTVSWPALELEHSPIPAWVNTAVHFYNNTLYTLHGIREQEADGMWLQRYSDTTGEPLEDATALAVGILHNTTRPRASLSEGKVFTTWLDARFGGDWYYTPYFQIQDLETGQPLLESQGRLVAPGSLVDHPRGQTTSDLQTAPDGEGGEYVVWNAWENGTGSQSQGTLYGQRISADGELLWGDEGIVLADACDSNYDNQTFLTVTSDNVLHIAYTTQTEATGWQKRVWLLAVSPDGDSMWGDPVDTHVEWEEDLHLEPLSLFAVNSTDIILVQELGVGMYPSDVPVECIRYSAEGTEEWRVSRIFSTMMPNEVRTIQLNGEDGIGVFATNRDGQMYLRIGLDGEVLTTPDIMMLRDFEIDYWGGPLQPYTTSDGFAVLYRQDEPPYDLVMERYSPEGNPLFVGDEPPVVVEAGTIDLYNPELIMDGEDGFYFICSVHNDGQADLVYTHVTGSGDLALPDYEQGPEYLCSANFCQQELFAISDGSGGFVAAWNDYRGSPVAIGADDIYTMRVNDNTTGIDQPAVEAVPSTWALNPAYPNPFNPSTTISINVPHSGQVKLAVYDLLGREVVRLANREMAAGEHRFVWYGVSSSGKPTASGTYIVRLHADDGIDLARRVVLVK